MLLFTRSTFAALPKCVLLNTGSIKRYKALLRSSMLILLSAFALSASAQSNVDELSSAEIAKLLQGSWQINEQLSDNTDERVEEAIKKAGGKVNRRWFSRKQEDRYRGGPEDQELYDRISYDDVLTISHQESEFLFVYADDFRRVFYSDGRRQRAGASEFYQSGGQDNSFASWEGQVLQVEARPRDGGYSLESYTLIDNNRLRVEMEIRPASFGATILLTRIYDRSE